MLIHGMNKLTLTDYPGLVAAILFTGSCNLRCPFCYNSPLVLSPESEPTIPEDEIFSFLKKRKGMLDGVVLTGGEPLIHEDAPLFLEKLKGTGLKVKLDTNGTNPRMLREIIEAGLVDYVAMDVKNSLDAYPETVGNSGFDTSGIVESVSILHEGKVAYEFRTTVTHELHYEENFRKICALISPCERYFLQSFSTMGDTISKNITSPSADDMKIYLEIVRNYISTAEIRS